jgi:Flp pilus assembly protein TadG
MRLHRSGDGMATKRRRTRGQSLVEFALVLPVFLLLIFGIIDLGRFVYMNSTISQAAREAARVASVEASWIGSSRADCNQPAGPVCPANVNAFKADVLAAANREMAPFGSIAAADLYTSCAATAPTPVTTQTCGAAAADRAPGNLVAVRTVITFRPITPIISSIVSSVITSGSATMVIN